MRQCLHSIHSSRFSERGPGTAVHDQQHPRCGVTIPWAWPWRCLVVDRQEPNHMFPRLIQRRVCFGISRVFIGLTSSSWLSNHERKSLLNSDGCCELSGWDPTPPTAPSFDKLPAPANRQPSRFSDPAALQPCRSEPHPRHGEIGAPQLSCNVQPKFTRAARPVPRSCPTHME